MEIQLVAPEVAPTSWYVLVQYCTYCGIACYRWLHTSDGERMYTYRHHARGGDAAIIRASSVPHRLCRTHRVPDCAAHTEYPTVPHTLCTRLCRTHCVPDCAAHTVYLTVPHTLCTRLCHTHSVPATTTHRGIVSFRYSLPHYYTLIGQHKEF